MPAWRLHHHPANAPLVPMYTSICAEGMARMIGSGYAERFKTAAFRLRQAQGKPGR